MTSEELIKKIYAIVQYWQSYASSGMDEATNSAAWSFHHGRYMAFDAILNRLQQGEETIEKIYQNIRYR